MENVVFGNNVDSNFKCNHYNSDVDIVAIRFKCCDKYYACIFCHSEMENHEVEVWQKNEQNTVAISCGNCREEISIKEYLNCENTCPACTSAFNPKCNNHYHYYFEQ